MLEMFCLFFKDFKDKTVSDTFIQNAQELRRGYRHFGKMIEEYKCGEASLNEEFSELQKFYNGFMAMIELDNKTIEQIQKIAKHLRDNDNIDIWVPSHTNIYHIDGNMRNFVTLKVDDCFSPAGILRTEAYDSESKVHFLLSPWLGESDHHKLLKQALFPDSSQTAISLKLQSGDRVISFINTISSTANNCEEIIGSLKTKDSKFIDLSQSLKIEPGQLAVPLLDTIKPETEIISDKQSISFQEIFKQRRALIHHIYSEDNLKLQSFISLPTVSLDIEHDVNKIYFINFDDIFVNDIRKIFYGFLGDTKYDDNFDSLIEDLTKDINKFNLGNIGEDDIYKSMRKKLSNFAFVESFVQEFFHVSKNEWDNFISQINILKTIQETNNFIKIIFLSFTNSIRIRSLFSQFRENNEESRLKMSPAEDIIFIDNIQLFTTYYYRQSKTNLFYSLICLLKTNNSYAKNTLFNSDHSSELISVLDTDMEMRDKSEEYNIKIININDFLNIFPNLSVKK